MIISVSSDHKGRTKFSILNCHRRSRRPTWQNKVREVITNCFHYIQSLCLQCFLRCANIRDLKSLVILLQENLLQNTIQRGKYQHAVSVGIPSSVIKMKRVCLCNLEKNYPSKYHFLRGVEIEQKPTAHLGLVLLQPQTQK